MPCYRPIKGYRDKSGTFTMKPTGLPMAVKCSKCIGCRLERSRQWAVRCLHEAQMHPNNCFITLTFNDEAMKKRQSTSLRKRDFQLFMKKLRKKYGPGIRYYHCGEYGEKKGRPHYHAILFNHQFADRKIYKKQGTYVIYTSKELEEIWGHGFCTIGDANFETAAYVARYILKKKFGKQAEEHYVDKTTGEVRLPEYTTMSRRPGIGSLWYEKHSTDVYPADVVVARGRQMKPPNYYDRLYEKAYPEAYRNMKLRRRLKNLDKKIEQLLKTVDEREASLEQQERVREYNQSQLKRRYEHEA